MPTARDILEYLNWWEHMLWRGEHRADPNVQWQADLSWDQIAAATGTEAPQTAPEDIAINDELAVELYWPAAPPNHAQPARISRKPRANQRTRPNPPQPRPEGLQEQPPDATSPSPPETVPSSLQAVLSRKTPRRSPQDA